MASVVYYGPVQEEADDDSRTVLERIDGEFWDGDAVSTANKAKRWAESLNVSSIPYLTRKLYRSGTIGPGARLVRWVGMVQDMGSPEFYRAKESLFRDALGPIESAAWQMGDVGGKDVADRQKLYCVPVPGLTDWARQTIVGDDDEAMMLGLSSSSGKAKRGRDDDDHSDDDNSANSRRHHRFAHPPPKGKVPDEKMAARRRLAAQIRAEKEETQRWRTRQTLDVDVVVRWYPFQQTEELGMPARLNEIVEIIGVLGAEVGGSPTSEDWDAATSVVGRVHALSLRVIAPQVFAVPRFVVVDAERVRFLRRAAIERVIAPALGGHVLVAEYVFLAILSRPYRRIPPDRVLGSASVEILTQPDCASQLHRAIKAIVPVTSLVKTSTVEKPPKRQLVGARSFAEPFPAFDAEERPAVPNDAKQEEEDSFFGRDERLVKDHPLQVTPGTVVVVDHDSLFWESCKALVGPEKFVMYDFNYEEYTRVERVDIPVVVVTNNRRGVGADCSVPLALDALETVVQSHKVLDDDPVLLADIRAYVNHARDHGGLDDASQLDEDVYKTNTLDFGDDVATAVEHDFVQFRKANLIPGQIAESSLHFFLAMLRLHAKSLLATHVTLDHWRHCRDLEHKRLVQLASHRRVAGL